MEDAFLGEVRLFGGNFAPIGWAFCDGQSLDIGTNDALFSLLGTTYGGDGVRTFKLPDLRGRVPVHQSPGHPLGETASFETAAAMPDVAPHGHMQPNAAVNYIIALEGIYPSQA